MNIIYFLLKITHYIVCVLLIVIVLLQGGKGSNTVGIFGNAGSDQIFNSPSGTSVIKKITVLIACFFLFTSLMLTKFSYNSNMSSVIDEHTSTSIDDK
jgi:preprotein translocase subunit SecG